MAPEALFIFVFSYHPMDDEAVKTVHEEPARVLRIWEILGSNLDNSDRLFIVFLSPFRRMLGYASN
jgi:hypothetical protein